jgi:cytochrome c biogenesis protein CcmG, thiol:disulfide interchange protein DsbE
MDGKYWMQNQSSFNKVGQLVTIIITLAILLSACSGGNLPQSESAQMSAQLQAKQSLPGQEPSKQDLPDARPAKQTGSAAKSPEPAAAVQQLAQAAAAEPAPSAPAPAPAEAVAPASVDTASKSAPAVDLSIPAEPKVGFRAPDFTLQTLGGETMRLSDLIGRPVVISYWATWCIPCQQEIPILQNLAQEYQAQGLTVLTINAIDQDTVQDVQTMVGEKGMTIPVLLDQGSQFASTYGALFFPTTIFVDASGVIRYIRLGDSSEEDLRTKVENLLAGAL